MVRIYIFGKDIFNVHWPNSLGLIEGFCTVCEQPWVDLNPRPFAQKATTLTTAPRRQHTNDRQSSKLCQLCNRSPRIMVFLCQSPKKQKQKKARIQITSGFTLLLLQQDDIPSRWIVAQTAKQAHVYTYFLLEHLYSLFIHSSLAQLTICPSQWTMHWIYYLLWFENSHQLRFQLETSFFPFLQTQRKLHNAKPLNHPECRARNMISWKIYNKKN